MEKLALLVTLKAKAGKEKDVEKFLKGGLALVQAEPDTKQWYALQIDESTYGIFDTFENEAGRDAHLSGEVAKALMAQAPDLFSAAPEIKKVTLLAIK